MGASEPSRRSDGNGCRRLRAGIRPSSEGRAVPCAQQAHSPLRQNMTRVLLIAGTLLLAVAAGSCRPYSASEKDGPEQPIAFYHKVHAGDNKIPCQYCHYTAD